MNVSPRFKRALESELRRLTEQYGRSSLNRPPSAGMTDKQLRRKDTLAAYKEYPKLGVSFSPPMKLKSGAILLFMVGWQPKEILPFWEVQK